MTKPIDIAGFGELIDDYQCSQIDGTHSDRAAARIALMNAYRASLASSDAQAGDAVAGHLFEVLMRRNIEVSDEAYLSLRVVGVPPSKREFAQSIKRAVEQATKEKGNG